MNPSTLKVFELLKRKKRRGVTFHDFHTGFRLGARIKDLRDTGVNIITNREPLPNGWYARYVLLAE